MSAQMSRPQCYKPVGGGCDIKTVSSAAATKNVPDTTLFLILSHKIWLPGS